MKTLKLVLAVFVAVSLVAVYASAVQAAVLKNPKPVWRILPGDTGNIERAKKLIADFKKDQLDIDGNGSVTSMDYLKVNEMFTLAIRYLPYLGPEVLVLDLNKDGKIDKEDMLVAGNRIKNAVSGINKVVEFASLMSEVALDMNKDGKVDAQDVMVTIERYALAAQYAKYLPVDTFRVLDKDGNGVLDGRDGRLATDRIQRAIIDIDKVNEFAVLLAKDPIDIDANGIVEDRDYSIVKEGFRLAMMYKEYLPDATLARLDVNRDGSVNKDDEAYSINMIKLVIAADRKLKEQFDINAYKPEKMWWSIDKKEIRFEFAMENVTAKVILDTVSVQVRMASYMRKSYDTDGRFIEEDGWAYNYGTNGLAVNSNHTNIGHVYFDNGVEKAVNRTVEYFDSKGRLYYRAWSGEDYEQPNSYNGGMSYLYDANGNLTKEEWGTTYYVAENKTSTVKGVRLYDTNGRVIKQEINNCKYGEGGRIISAFGQVDEPAIHKAGTYETKYVYEKESGVPIARYSDIKICSVAAGVDNVRYLKVAYKYNEGGKVTSTNIFEEGVPDRIFYGELLETTIINMWQSSDIGFKKQKIEHPAVIEAPVAPSIRGDASLAATLDLANSQQDVRNSIPQGVSLVGNMAKDKKDEVVSPALSPIVKR